MKPEAKNVWIHSLKATAIASIFNLIGYALMDSELGGGLFLAAPLITGFAIAFMSKGKKIAAITALTSLVVSLSILLFTGLEGVGCVIMAFPILFVGIGAGAFMGHMIAKERFEDHGNTHVIATCLGLLTLVGWTNRHMESPKSLEVQTSLRFEAPMNDVWSAVTESGEIQGDDRLLNFLGLPTPYRCHLNDEGLRVCDFDQGSILQEITHSEYGARFDVRIVDAFEVRHWLSFKRARYDFTQLDGEIEVTRTDEIRSTLRPRWYWSWFETQCVRLEHNYVMKSIKAKAESQ